MDLPPSFSETGMFVQRAGPVPTQFQVLGERSSGTNVVKRLLGRNTAMTPTEALGWKHGFPQAVAIPADFLVVCMVRNAVDWARSMHAKPWHATPAIQALEFPDFIRAEWRSTVDRARYFEGARDTGLIGQPLQQDRDPLSGACFSNLFALRRAKLTGLLSYLNRGCSVALLRMEEATATPETMLEALRDGLGLTAPAGPFQPVQKRLGSKFRPAGDAPRPATPDRVGAADMAFLRGQVDPAQEARLGYAY